MKGLAVLLTTLSGILPVLIYLTGSQTSIPQAVPALRDMPVFEQVALVGAVYLVKPLYMLLALGVVLLLWRRAGAVLPAVSWSLVLFLAGELACWINILFFVYESAWLEYLHSVLMVGCLGFLAFALMEAFDHGLVHFSDPKARCSLTGICRTCTRSERGGCLLRRLFQWGIPLTAVTPFLLLTAQPRFISYNALVFGRLRNLTHPLPIQLYELRFSPIAALALLAGCWVLLVWQGHTRQGLQRSKVLLAAALGYLGFSFMRLALMSFYGEDLVWLAVWEEMTELVLVIGVIACLWVLLPDFKARLRWSNLQGLMD